jgi:hypothetical protein
MSAGHRLSAIRSCLPWSSTALQGREPGGPGRVWVPSDPYGVSTPCGYSPSEPRLGPKTRAGPSCACSSFGDESLQPRTAASPSTRRPNGDPSRDAASPGLSCPTTQSRTGGPASSGGGPPPPRATCEVWIPPSRRPPPILPAREAPERPWASPFKVFPSCARGAPFGVLTLLTLPGTAPIPPKEERAGRGRLQGLVLATSPCCRSTLTRRPSRRCLPGLSPSRAFAPSVRATACSHGAGPLALGRDDVPIHLGLRASRSGWIGWSVSGLPALLGFRTLQRSRHSVHRFGERAHGFTSCRTTRMTRATDCTLNSLGNDAVADPRPATRCRRSSALD